MDNSFPSRDTTGNEDGPSRDERIVSSRTKKRRFPRGAGVKRWHGACFIRAFVWLFGFFCVVLPVYLFRDLGSHFLSQYRLSHPSSPFGPRYKI
jgi:hypothetical protein